MARLYGEIAKTEQQDDGTVKVWGYASSEAVDSDGEIITAEAMKAAIPDYMKFGAVREMHGKSAAGTAIEIKVEDDGRTYFGAHVVDPVAVLKVQTGVYKGFSIGGTVTARDDLNKSLIKGVKLTEISLVDRPANPDAVFTCFKADKGAEQAEDDKDADAADVPAENGKPDDAVGQKDDQADEAEKADFTPDEIARLREMLNKSADEPVKTELVEKSMYDVSELAGVIRGLQWFISDSEYSQLPDEVVGKAKTAAGELMDALKALVEHEAGSLNAEKAAQPESLQKTAQADELAKAQADLAAAKAEIEALKQQPEAPKGSLKAVSKAEDNGGEQDPLNGFTPIVKSDGTLDDVATLIKAAQTGRL